MRRWVTSAAIFGAALLMCGVFGPGCKKSEPAGPNGVETGANTPEATFEQVKKALVNRDPDLMWDLLSPGMKKIFEEGRRELLTKPIEEQEEIARGGMTTVSGLHELSTKGFFRFYFEYKKREVYRMNTAKMLEWRIKAVREAKVMGVDYEGEAAAATKAVVNFDMADKAYFMSLAKSEGRWLLDSMEQPEIIEGELPEAGPSPSAKVDAAAPKPAGDAAQPAPAPAPGDAPAPAPAPAAPAPAAPAPAPANP